MAITGLNSIFLVLVVTAPPPPPRMRKWCHLSRTRQQYLKEIPRSNKEPCTWKVKRYQYRLTVSSILQTNSQIVSMIYLYWIHWENKNYFNRSGVQQKEEKYYEMERDNAQLFDALGLNPTISAKPRSPIVPFGSGMMLHMMWVANPLNFIFPAIL